MPRLTPLWLGLCLLSPGSALAGGGLDVSAWIARPGVRLVAVEFYATWCEPCMKAVPRWKALHERYRKDGLRLIVVSTRDTDGSCTNPGWNPDDIICDDEGFLADRFGASSLPAAFLWSWQGDLLVKRGHVDEVERRIAAWMPTAPRVDVDVGKISRGAGVKKRELADLVRAELRQDDKLVVVATAQERRRLDALRKQSFKARYDETMQCEVGKEMSANGLVRAKITGRKSRQRLHVQLLSAERGCLVASAVVGWSVSKPGVSIAEGIRELMQSLQAKVEMPWSSASGIAQRADAAPDSPYAKMAAELANADRAKKARAKKLERAWSVVTRFAGSRSIAKERRISAVEQFLKDFPGDNPRAPEARKMLASLRPPPPRPAPAIRTAPPPTSVRTPARTASQRRAKTQRPRRRPPGFGDLDGDGVIDRNDVCPDSPEDKDGFEDADGCPEPDNDKDGISDARDKCPMAPETVNGFEDEDGCPDTMPAVRVKAERLDIREKVFFATGKATILRRSFGLLDQIAAIMKNDRSMNMRIEGHTDGRGSAKANLRLSQRRAESVAHQLVARGISRRRVQAKGYGETRPIDDNRTKKGRANNRRIEFIVVR